MLPSSLGPGERRTDRETPWAEHYASYSQVVPVDTAVLQLEINI